MNSNQIASCSPLHSGNKVVGYDDSMIGNAALVVRENLLVCPSRRPYHNHHSHDAKAKAQEHHPEKKKSSKSSADAVDSLLHNFDEVVGQTDIPKFLKKHDTRLRFPEKLLLMIEHAEREEMKLGRDPSMACLAWTRAGNAVVLRNTQDLYHKILPLAGCQAKFISFTRKLYRWGFRQVMDDDASDATSKKDGRTKVFHHPLFQRKNKELVTRMKSITAEATRRAQSAQNLTKQQDAIVEDQLKDQEPSKAVHLNGLAPDPSTTMFPMVHPGGPSFAMNTPTFQDSIWAMFHQAIAQRTPSSLPAPPQCFPHRPSYPTPSYVASSYQRPHVTHQFRRRHDTLESVHGPSTNGARSMPRQKDCLNIISNAMVHAMPPPQFSFRGNPF